jgi:hypothetical protein
MNGRGSRVTRPRKNGDSFMLHLGSRPKAKRVNPSFMLSVQTATSNGQHAQVQSGNVSFTGFEFRLIPYAQVAAFVQSQMDRDD